MTIKHINGKHLALGALLIIGIALGFFTLQLKREAEDSQYIIPGKTAIKTALENQTPFLTKQGTVGEEHYVGSQTSSNYRVYVEKDDTLVYYVDKNPTEFPHPTLDLYTNDLGNPDLILYGPWFTSGGYKSYVFLKQGAVIIAHPISKVVTEIWHIPPNLSQESFNIMFKSIFNSQPPQLPNQF